MLTTFTSFFKKNPQAFDAVIFDIDGTLARGRDPLPGAIELLEYLNEVRYPYLLLTNDSCTSVEKKAGYLNKSGLPVVPEQILSAGNALEYWAKSENYSGELFFLYGTLGEKFAKSAGINLTDDPALSDHCHGVIAGEGRYNWQPGIEAAFNLLLKHPEYPLIVANPDSYWPSLKKNGEFGIGAGAVARFICQLLTDAGKPPKVPVYLGKPYAPIYQCLGQFLKQRFPDRKFQNSSKIVMLGDSLTSDIAGANRNDLCSALVMSGITDSVQLAAAEGDLRPQLIFSGV